MEEWMKCQCSKFKRLYFELNIDGGFYQFKVPIFLSLVLNKKCNEKLYPVIWATITCTAPDINYLRRRRREAIQGIFITFRMIRPPLSGVVGDKHATKRVQKQRNPSRKLDFTRGKVGRKDGEMDAQWLDGLSITISHGEKGFVLLIAGVCNSLKCETLRQRLSWVGGWKKIFGWKHQKTVWQ